MTDLRALVEIANAFGTPLLALIAYFLWRVYNNHLPHIETTLTELIEAVARIQGRNDERDAR